MRVVVTGGAGFIGSAVVRLLASNPEHQILTLDKLGYAAVISSLDPVAGLSNHEFRQLDLCDGQALNRIVGDFSPQLILHLAAESHVDRSIDSPSPFIQSNVVGTFNLLESARLNRLAERHADFRFVQVPTDEVYGLLGADGVFSEGSAYRPNSPYAASKAAADHLVQAWHVTYGLPTIITHCSNNYRPYQFPEKLIPLIILNALGGKSIPVYGDGLQVRDWLYVDDHVDALWRVACNGLPGATYNIGACAEKTNLQVVQTVIDAVAAVTGAGAAAMHARVTHVPDRPGHDRRYAIDPMRITNELGWQPSQDFDSGIEHTVRWYLAHPQWCEQAGERYHGERLGQRHHA